MFKSKTQKQIEELERLKKLQEELSINRGIPDPAPSPTFDDAILDARSEPSNEELIEGILRNFTILYERIKKDAKPKKSKM